MQKIKSDNMNAKTKKQEPKFNTISNYKPFKGVKNNSDSKTIPDDCLSLKQLLINHTRGLDLNVQMKGIYTEDYMPPVFNDLTEKMEYQKNLLEKKQKVEKELQELKKAKVKESEQTTEDTPPNE